ncbi:MAG: energy-coupling factor transporter ATPase [Oscillospiraceae bacterium]|nr:energy-coupling factor transporter ATPase [Oscillospiraceae bacterium]
MAHFEIKDLIFTYPHTDKPALKGVSLSIEKGEYLCLCGRSGSGKTTLMRHLKSVLTPYGKREGKILFEGTDISEVDQRTQSAKIGYVMQDPDSQIVTDKVWHELAFGLESLGCDQRTMRLRVAEMASYFGIQGWFHKNVAELSGGQKQLLNLASIMAMQPEVLILDEPTSQLDPIAASDFLNTVKKINRELGTTVILSEHRLEEVFPSSDRVVVMEHGRIIADESPRTVGERLRELGSDMLSSLPSPVLIHQALESSLPCPLTVREGRSFLSEELAEVEIRRPSIEAEKPYEEPDEPAVELKELWFRYAKELPDILRGVSLKVAPGTLHAVVGGNGTGKSTTLKAVSGIVKPYRGKVLIQGKKLESYKSADLFKGCLAMLPQDPKSLFVKKTVEEDLLEMLDGRGMTEEEKKQRIAEVAELCEVTELLRSHPYDLSGGEQQRSALAKVLLCDPKILCLDEPTKGIDCYFKDKLAQLLLRLKERDVTILMVSHDVEFCAKYADAVSMFFDGSVITTNTPNSFFARNSFYTTAANRMSRHLFTNAVTNEDVVRLCRENREA